MRSSYAGYYRQALPAVLGALEFRSNNAAHRPVVRALDLVKAYAGSPKRYYDEDEEVDRRQLGGYGPTHDPQAVQASHALHERTILPESCDDPKADKVREYRRRNATPQHFSA